MLSPLFPDCLGSGLGIYSSWGQDSGSLVMSPKLFGMFSVNDPKRQSVEKLPRFSQFFRSLLEESKRRGWNKLWALSPVVLSYIRISTAVLGLFCPGEGTTEKGVGS